MTDPSPITEAQLRERLRAACDAAGGQRAYADTIGVSDGMVCFVLRGKRRPGPKICYALGLTECVERRYIPITEN